MGTLLIRRLASAPAVPELAVVPDDDANEIIEGGRRVADEGFFLMIRRGSVEANVFGTRREAVGVGKEDEVEDGVRWEGGRRPEGAGRGKAMDEVRTGTVGDEVGTEAEPVAGGRSWDEDAVRRATGVTGIPLTGGEPFPTDGSGLLLSIETGGAS